MEFKSPVGLNAIIQQLREIDELAIHGDVSHHFLEFEISGDKSEFRINGNQAGLVYFARVILEVAASSVSGSHFHLDDTGIADKCDMPVVVCLKPADWKK